jgi:hypothetical protein
MDEADEGLSLETPRTWVRQGERRAERQWAKAHLARPIYDETPKPPPPSRGRRPWAWLVVAAVVLLLVLAGIGAKSHAPRRAIRSRHAMSHAASSPASTTPPTMTPSALATTDEWPDARVAVTGCTNATVSGSLTNTGSGTDSYFISVAAWVGWPVAGGSAEVLNVAPGQVVQWATPVALSNTPGSPTCVVDDVYAEPDLAAVPTVSAS